MITEDDSLKHELAQTKQELLELRKEINKLQSKRQQILHNSVFITIMRYVLVFSLGGIALVAVVLSGANYERKSPEGEFVSFKGTEFKTALLGLATIAASGVGAVGFGDRFIKKAEEKE
jgi:hypothetical protein